MSYTPEEAEDEGAAILDEIKTEGPALVVRSGGGRAGEHFLLENDSTTVGRSPDCDVFLDDVTVSRRHAQVLRRDGDVRDRGQGQPQRHVPQPPPDRVGPARGRRRGPDRQVQADLSLPVSAAAQAPSRNGLLHIGAVCRHLRDEFPDVSISKIRYLEDQGLLTTKRTQGGYRLFDEDAVERLRTILRLQRDEFLPLRVIRQELVFAGCEQVAPAPARRPGSPGLRRSWTRASSWSAPARRLSCARARGVRPARGSRGDGGEKRYSAGDAEIAAVCAQLASFGVGPRNLRPFRTAADREGVAPRAARRADAAHAQPRAPRGCPRRL